MSEKRFEMKGDTHIFDSQTSEEYYAPSEYELVDLLNSLSEEISYWKHRVSSLLFILSQFDKDKVKKLLEELDE